MKKTLLVLGILTALFYSCEKIEELDKVFKEKTVVRLLHFIDRQNNDITLCQPKDILNTEVIITIVGGKIVYSKL